MKLRATVLIRRIDAVHIGLLGGGEPVNQTNSNNNTQTGSRPDIYGNYTNVTAGGSTENATARRQWERKFRDERGMPTDLPNPARRR
jgi:hypothetical protein